MALPLSGYFPVTMLHWSDPWASAPLLLYCRQPSSSFQHLQSSRQPTDNPNFVASCCAYRPSTHFLWNNHKLSDVCVCKTAPVCCGTGGEAVRSIGSPVTLMLLVYAGNLSFLLRVHLLWNTVCRLQKIKATAERKNARIGVLKSHVLLTTGHQSCTMN